MERERRQTVAAAEGERGHERDADAGLDEALDRPGLPRAEDNLRMRTRRLEQRDRVIGAPAPLEADERQAGELRERDRRRARERRVLPHNEEVRVAQQLVNLERPVDERQDREGEVELSRSQQ